MNLQGFYNAIGGNLEEAKSRLMNETLVLKFVKKFITTGDYELLVKSYQNDDKPEVYRAVHTLKGMSLNMAFTNFANMCTEFCEKYKAQNFSSYNTDVKVLCDEYLKIKKLIEELE